MSGVSLVHSFSQSLSLLRPLNDFPDILSTADSFVSYFTSQRYLSVFHSVFHSLLCDKMPEEKQLRGEKNCIGSWLHRIQFKAFGVTESGPGETDRYRGRNVCSKEGGQEEGFLFTPFLVCLGL